jgi:hypothetical protein
MLDADEVISIRLPSIPRHEILPDLDELTVWRWNTPDKAITVQTKRVSCRHMRIAIPSPLPTSKVWMLDDSGVNERR